MRGRTRVGLCRLVQAALQGGHHRNWAGSEVKAASGSLRVLCSSSGLANPPSQTPNAFSVTTQAVDIHKLSSGNKENVHYIETMHRLQGFFYWFFFKHLGIASYKVL